MFTPHEMIEVLVPQVLRMRELQKATTPGAPNAHRVAVREAEMVVDSLMAVWANQEADQKCNAEDGTVRDE